MKTDDLPIRRLTPEIVEACMDRDSAEILGRSEEEIVASDVWIEIQVFDRCVMASERIRGEFLGIATALFDQEATESKDGSLSIEHLQRFLRSGKVSALQMEILTQAVRAFFFIGWHARGAVEDAERMKSL